MNKNTDHAARFYRNEKDVKIGNGYLIKFVQDFIGLISVMQLVNFDQNKYLKLTKRNIRGMVI